MSDLQQSFPRPLAYLVVLSGTKTTLKEKSNATDLRKHRVSVLAVSCCARLSEPGPAQACTRSRGSVKLASLTEYAESLSR